MVTADPADPSDPRRGLGALGETIACAHLRRRGYALLARNYRTRWGELDIVAVSDDCLVICEVKTRRLGPLWHDPLESIGAEKRRRVRRMAAQWLAENPGRSQRCECRFDAIGVTVDRSGQLIRLDHLEGAF
ncbi:YraN family protein [Conexibacter sp. DBS9H8]|uniref:YraN family protein n=1 Tax=Conexibacter sp. DBS9H8 TaxID=2937801 RepID=UPI00200CDE9D|nr:YraN family protein [Conexibacter sp. DBS9H8]